MTANDRMRARAAGRARRILAELASEIREARLAAGFSQCVLGGLVGMSGDKIWQIEHERLPSLSISDACQIGAVLGLDFAARVFPNGAHIRDASQSRRLVRLLANVGSPLRYRTDVALPAADNRFELRAWDALVSGCGERTGIELESRLGDVQSVVRRHHLKRRDDPVDHFLFVVADTKHNRRVLAEFQDLMPDLPRLRTATVLRLLASGCHPPTGIVLF
jgi:transcriptional regulator with XRE-family HTH domain